MTLDHTDTSDQKRQLRQIYLQRRLEVAQEAYHSASTAIKEHFLSSADLTKPRKIAGYLPMRGEVDIVSLFHTLHKDGHTCCLPVVVAPGAALQFRTWTPGEVLEEGRFGIRVPPTGNDSIVPDILLLPLLAFDGMGYRLGYGGGYYDTTLRKLRMANHPLVAIGAAFALQQAKKLPHEPQDEKLDAILTEKGISWL